MNGGAGISPAPQTTLVRPSATERTIYGVVGHRHHLLSKNGTNKKSPKKRKTPSEGSVLGGFCYSMEYSKPAPWLGVVHPMMELLGFIHHEDSIVGIISIVKSEKQWVCGFADFASLFSF
jgi:hypothetical protein